MGKKGKKKTLYKRTVGPFVSDNRVLLAALGGAATGIALATILGSEKAKQMIDTIGESVKDFSSKVTDSLKDNGHDFTSEEVRAKRKNPAM